MQLRGRSLILARLARNCLYLFPARCISAANAAVRWLGGYVTFVHCAETAKDTAVVVTECK